MNPAHVFLISLAGLAVYWLGFLTASDVTDNDEAAPFVVIPSILLNAAGAGFLLTSLWKVIAQAL